MNDKINIKGKKYIVTGASSGIGRSTAVCIAECGGIVVLVGRDNARLNETKEMLEGSGHISICCDLTDESQIEGVFDEAVSDGIKISGLVHSAGIAPIIPLQNLNRDKMIQCMDINLFAFINLVRYVSKIKYRADNVSIVEISSINSECPEKCQTIYAASKAAANIAVQALAIELANKGIRINSILPGSVKTPMTEMAFLNMPDEVIQRKEQKQLLGLSKPDEIANVVLFLLGDMSSALTGRILYADGGYINF